MENMFKELISSFMESNSYQKLFESQEKINPQMDIVREEFLTRLDFLTSAAELEEAEKENTETIVSNYQGEIEKTIFTTGFLFAFKIFQDITKYTKN